MIPPNKECIVGLDIDYYTTASAVNICNNNAKTDPNYIHRLTFYNVGANENRHIKTNIWCKNGKYSIDIPGGDSLELFNKRITTLSNDIRAAHINYIRLIFERLLTYNYELKRMPNGDYNFLLCIACAYDDQEEKSARLALFNEALALYGINVFLMTNRFDAPIFAFKDIEQMSQGMTIAINYGYRSIEFICYDNTHKMRLYICNPYHGFNIVGKIAIEDYRNNEPDDFLKSYEGSRQLLQETNNEHISIIDRLVCEATKNIERAIYCAENVFSIYINFKHFTGIKEFEKYSFDYDANIDYVLAQYINAIENDMRCFKNEVSLKMNSTKIDNIVIFGNASFAPWVKSIARNVFADVNINQYLLLHHAISDGIVLNTQYILNKQ